MAKLLNPIEILHQQNAIDEQSNAQSFDVLQNNAPSLGFGQNVALIVKECNSAELCHYYSDGAWSLHQLLIGLLSISGNANVYISSFAMSETAVRTISALQESGAIKSLHCVIDNRVETRSAGSLQLLKSISTRIALRACHAKVTLLYGEKCNIAIIGSANYTENKRMEVGFVSKNKETCDFHKQWTENILNNG